MSYKYDAFLSYSKLDEWYIEQIKKELLKNDINFFDFNYNFKITGDIYEQITEAINESEYSLIFLSSQMVNSCFISEELSIIESVKHGLKVIFIALSELITERECDLLLDSNLNINFYYSVLKGSATDVAKIVSQRIKNNTKIIQLYKDAYQAWVYGAYEQAYNCYLALVDLVEDDAKLDCYDRAANCCEKTGKWEEAKKLYSLSKNELALKRLENNTKSKEVISPKEVNQELLYKIANYCDASIDLFYELLKDNQSPEGLNCLKTSYTRLLNYCKTIGGMDDVISSALSKMKESEKEFAKGKLIVEETKNDIIKQYRTYLGLEFPESDNYDVFISYKSEDEMLARRVYDYLLSEGKRVFLACEVLPDMGKTEYRDAIMDALDHSQHFVLVTSKLDYITSNWVKEEWSFYVSKLIEDNHKGNLAIIIHDDFKVDKNQLPPNLRYKQRLLMSNFKESLLKYLQQ